MLIMITIVLMMILVIMISMIAIVVIALIMTTTHMCTYSSARVLISALHATLIRGPQEASPPPEV